MIRTKINLLSIAFRNLSRHRVKTTLTLLAISIGIGLYIWMDAWLKGMNLDSRRNLINYETGSVKIYSRAYFEKKDELPMYESFNNYQPLIERLDENGFNAAPHFVFTGSLMSEEQELPFVFIGIDPEKEKKVLKYYKFIQPPYKIDSEAFETDILLKINNQIDKKFLNEVYIKNTTENAYFLKDLNFEKYKIITKINKKILELQNKIKAINNNKGIIFTINKLINKIPFINIKIDQYLLNKYNDKLDQLNLKYKLQKNRIQRAYLDKIKKIFDAIGYYNFLNDNSFETIIGVKGATDLKVKIGDQVRCSVTIDIKDEIGKIRHVNQVIDLIIAGIVNSPNPKTNGYISYLPLNILQDEKGLLLNGKITEICIRKKGVGLSELPGKDDSPEVVKNILRDIIPDNLIVVGWREDAKDYLAMSAGDIVSTYIMIGLLFILAIVGITNTMLMAIFERIKEIGMLRSMGMKDLDVIKLFILEALFIGLIGSIIGVIIGIPLDIWIIYKGIDYTSFMEQANMQDFGYRIVGIFRGAWNIHTIIGSLIVGPIIAGLTAIIPALKAIKMSIVDTLRFE